MTWYFIDEPNEQYVSNYDLTKLKTDEFYLDVNFSSFDDKIYLYYLNEQCVGVSWFFIILSGLRYTRFSQLKAPKECKLGKSSIVTRSSKKSTTGSQIILGSVYA
nr:unnamed protein product [Callosobruchus chinensis]